MPPSVLKGLLAAANSFDAGVRHSQVIEGFYVFTEDSTPSRGSFPDAIGTGYHWVSFATSEQALRAITLVSAVITHEQWIERVNHEHIARNPLQVALPHASAQFLVPTDFFLCSKKQIADLEDLAGAIRERMRSPDAHVENLTYRLDYAEDQIATLKVKSDG